MPHDQHKHRQTSTSGLTPTPATAYTTAATQALGANHDHVIIGLTVNVLSTDTGVTVDAHHGAATGPERPDQPAVTITTPTGAHCATGAGATTTGTRMCHDSGYDAHATMTVQTRPGRRPPTLTVTTNLPVRDQSITVVSGTGDATTVTITGPAGATTGTGAATMTHTGWSPPGQTTITITEQGHTCHRP